MSLHLNRIINHKITDFSIVENSHIVCPRAMAQKKRLYLFDIVSGKSIQIDHQRIVDKTSISINNIYSVWYRVQYMYLYNQQREFYQLVQQKTSKRVFSKLPDGEKRALVCLDKRLTGILSELSDFKDSNCSKKISKQTEKFLINLFANPKGCLSTYASNPGNDTKPIVFDHNDEQHEIPKKEILKQKKPVLFHESKKCIRCGEPAYIDSIFCWFHYSEENWRIK